MFFICYFLGQQISLFIASSVFVAWAFRILLIWCLCHLVHIRACGRLELCSVILCCNIFLLYTYSQFLWLKYIFSKISTHLKMIPTLKVRCETRKWLQNGCLRLRKAKLRYCKIWSKRINNKIFLNICI